MMCFERFHFGKYLLLFFICSASCNTVPDSDFNAKIRDYSSNNVDVLHSSNITTLQKEDYGQYAKQAPVNNAVVFKEEPDNAISSSSHSRGYVHDHSGHGSYDYEEIPYVYGYGYPDPNLHGIGHHPGHHGVHHGGHHGGHHLGYGHHHKYHDHHGLATKTLLWPLAGIALLGAAAALVSNPVLLQLGVVSGRRRRDTDAVTGPEVQLYLAGENSNKFHHCPNQNDAIVKNEFDHVNIVNSGKHKSDNVDIVRKTSLPKVWKRNGDYKRKVGPEDAVVKLIRRNDKLERKNNEKGMLKEVKQVVLFKRHPTAQSAIETVTLAGFKTYENKEDTRYIPVQLKHRKV